MPSAMSPFSCGTCAFKGRRQCTILMTRQDRSHVGMPLAQLVPFSDSCCWRNAVMRMVLPHHLLMEPLFCQQMLLECTLQS